MENILLWEMGMGMGKEDFTEIFWSNEKCKWTVENQSKRES